MPPPSSRPFPDSGGDRPARPETPEGFASGAGGAAGGTAAGGAGEREALAAAIDAALGYLTARSRSVSEVTGFLHRKHFPPGVAAAAEARLTELGLLDDRALARSWAEEALGRRREARARVERALAARGVAPELVAEAIGEAAAALAGGDWPGTGWPGGDDLPGGRPGGGEGGAEFLAGGGVWPEGGLAAGGEFERALELATKRLRVLHGSHTAVRRKLWGYLARRGYEAEVIAQVCARLLEAGPVTEPS
jgi:SOS response regulatory protein OraA/RecX